MIRKNIERGQAINSALNRLEEQKGIIANGNLLESRLSTGYAFHCSDETKAIITAVTLIGVDKEIAALNAELEAL